MKRNKVSKGKKIGQDTQRCLSSKVDLKAWKKLVLLKFVYVVEQLIQTISLTVISAMNLYSQLAESCSKYHDFDSQS